MAPIVRTEKLTHIYAVGGDKVIALNGVDLTIEKGEFCVIVGQSGSGKSTLLNHLAGLERPTRGHVYIGSHKIDAMTENELALFRQAHLGFIFQSYNLLPTMTAVENVALPLMFKGMSKAKRNKLAFRALRDMGLAGRANHVPTEMSGGQQQRVGIARAFVCHPKVIFADEPTGNLDSTTSKQVLYRMLEMTKKEGTTFVMVTHEPDLAACADRIITILDGQIKSNFIQDEDVKKKNRENLFASLEGNYSIGGVAAKKDGTTDDSPLTKHELDQYVTPPVAAAPSAPPPAAQDKDTPQPAEPAPKKSPEKPAKSPAKKPAEQQTPQTENPKEQATPAPKPGGESITQK